MIEDTTRAEDLIFGLAVFVLVFAPILLAASRARKSPPPPPQVEIVAPPPTLTPQEAEAVRHVQATGQPVEFVQPHPVTGQPVIYRVAPGPEGKTVISVAPHIGGIQQ